MHDSLFDNRPVHPGKILGWKLEEKGWTFEELATILDCTRQTIYLILKGKVNISTEMAAKLAAAFGNAPEEWLKWDNLYRLSVATTDVASVGKMAHLFDVAPVREMQRRGWIKLTADPSMLDAELKKFFATDSLDSTLLFPVATKRTVSLPHLNPSEKAWCFRARQIAERLVMETAFVPERLSQAERDLRRLAAYPKEARHVSKILANYGIRFLVIEPLPGVAIDGAAFWLGNSEVAEPVIALSLRHDRIDGFWFTLMHEFAHIRAGDAYSIDRELVDETHGISVPLVEDQMEYLANTRAADALIPHDDMRSFINRVGPSYSRERVIQFAHRMKIHPGIIVGQLQHKREIGYSALRDLLAKVREVIVSTSVTDGWSQTVQQM